MISPRAWLKSTHLIVDGLFVVSQIFLFNHDRRSISCFKISSSSQKVNSSLGGKSKILKNYTEILVSGLSIYEPTISNRSLSFKFTKKYRDIIDKLIRSERPLKQAIPKVMFISKNI
jgi:hypothetical protein